MKKFDRVRLRANGGKWVEGRIIIISENGVSLMVACDEPSTIVDGVAIMNEDVKAEHLNVRAGEVIVVLMRDDSGAYLDIMSNREYEVEEIT